MMGSARFFAESHQEIAEVVRTMNIDHKAFERKLAPCEIKRCGGNCCHDGATLLPTEVEPLMNLLYELGEDLEVGIPKGVDPIDRNAEGVWKTASIASSMSARIADYPQHFPNTKCVFLEESGVCRLQRKAMNEGRDAWEYKPFTCWMHPLSIGREMGTGRHLLTLRHEDNDPQRRDEYPGFVCHTHCGRTSDSGEPAYRVLQTELQHLGEIGERDVLGEIVRWAERLTPETNVSHRSYLRD